MLVFGEDQRGMAHGARAALQRANVFEPCWCEWITRHEDKRTSLFGTFSQTFSQSIDFPDRFLSARRENSVFRKYRVWLDGNPKVIGNFPES